MPEYIERILRERVEAELMDIGEEWKTVSEDPVGKIVWKGNGQYEREIFYAEEVLGAEPADSIRDRLGFASEDTTSIPRTLQGVEVFKALWRLRMYQRE